MPIFFYAIVRIAVAIVSMLTLLARPRLIGQLPWSYFRSLVRTRRRTTVATIALGLSLVLLVIGITEPPILIWCIVVGLSSIVASHVLGRRELTRG